MVRRRKRFPLCHSNSEIPNSRNIPKRRTKNAFPTENRNVRERDASETQKIFRSARKLPLNSRWMDTRFFEGGWRMIKYIKQSMCVQCAICYTEPQRQCRYIFGSAYLNSATVPNDNAFLSTFRVESIQQNRLVCTRKKASARERERGRQIKQTTCTAPLTVSTEISEIKILRDFGDENGEKIHTKNEEKRHEENGKNQDNLLRATSNRKRKSKYFCNTPNKSLLLFT